MAVSPTTAGPPEGLLGMMPSPTLGPSGLLGGLPMSAGMSAPVEPPPTAMGTEYDGHGETPATFGPHDTIRLRFGRSSDAFSPAEYKAYLEGGGDIDAAYAVREAASPWVPPSAPTTSSGPPGYSFITGTVDPTAAEIVSAAKASGMHIPPGFDPIAFSKMMSGGPTAFPTAPPPLSMSPTAAMPAPLMPPPMPTAMPSLMPTAMPSPIPIAASPRIATAVPKSPTKMGGGAGPYLGCDPITGKCPPYR
jgi:hypothetical protein